MTPTWGIDPGYWLINMVTHNEKRTEEHDTREDRCWDKQWLTGGRRV